MSSRARTSLLPALLALALALAPPASATITIVNMDGAGEGFNDPTPAAPVGGNPGTTVGQQRLLDFQRAAAIWDRILLSPVAISIQASFDPLYCTATSAVLGSAGPYSIERNFAGAPYAGTWFVTALANRLTGSDLEPGLDDIVAQFNSDIGGVTCLTGRAWYYGFDGNEGASGIDLLPVLLHEFGHGLGFLTETDETTGSFYSGTPDIFDRFLMDDVSGKHWYQMTASERIASSINTNHLVWDGPAVLAAASTYLGKRPQVVVSGAMSATLETGQANFGAPLTVGGVAGDVVLVNDGVGTATDGCESPFTNAAAVAGKVALIDRGTCNYAVKAANAQANGAIALLVANNAAGPAPGMSGVAPSVTIPVASIALADANTMKTALGSGTVHVVIGLDAAHLAGSDDAGKPRMFAPNPDQPGSSVSHFDVSAFPNLLMEPAINADLTSAVDLTYHAFMDIGWFPQQGNVLAVDPGETAFAFTHGPNPARDGGTLRFRLPGDAAADLSIFDVTGRRVATLVHGALVGGDHAVRWSRRDDAGARVPPGIYLARLEAGAIVRTLNVVIMD